MAAIHMINVHMINVRRSFVVTALAVIAVGSLAQVGWAQFFRGGAVGGVKVDVDGVLSNPQVSELKELRQAWQAGLQDVPADLQKPAELRFVSLKRLEAEAAKAQQSGQPIPDAVRFMAGLTRVKYVLVYPEQNDIVLAGPAEGWRVDALGNVVGASSGQPVLLLDDLMVALRAAEQANMSGISCSIDPTPEGMQRLQQMAGSMRAGSNPQAVAHQQEQALGLQKISVTGVPDTSHFARTLVAADFKMKRLGMGFERAPVDGMPSFLDMFSARTAGLQNMMPRWWLAPNYEPIRRDADGLAWELRGTGVKCLTEQDMMTAGGGRQHTGQGDEVAEKWANNFTGKFAELAREDSTFGQLRNAMDLSVVSALLAKENLTQFAGLEMPQLTVGVALEEYPAPKAVASQASLVKKGRNWLISVSGGVQIFPWQVADRTEVASDVASVRPQREAADGEGWYW
ncbi:MAG: DUF1598 domain-containing protein [Pirellulales bacterium]